MTSNAVALVATADEIAALPSASHEAAITAFLTGARDNLILALQATGPESVVMVKAEIGTVVDVTKRLNLSREIRDDAAEMLRRAEFAEDKAIKKGQAEGTVATPQDVRRLGGMTQTKQQRIPNQQSGIAPFPGDLDPSYYNNHAKGGSIAGMSDDVSDEQFEEALTVARAEGDLSRAHVRRKLKNRDPKRTRKLLADEIAALAVKGHTSAQIARIVNVGEDWIRTTARDYDVEIPADRATHKARRIDSNKVLESVGNSVATSVFALRQINPADLDREAAQEWVDSLTKSITALRRAVHTIKESIQ